MIVMNDYGISLTAAAPQIAELFGSRETSATDKDTPTVKQFDTRENSLILERHLRQTKIHQESNSLIRVQTNYSNNFHTGPPLSPSFFTTPLRDVGCLLQKALVIRKAPTSVPHRVDIG
jgi:hypothetical protein